MKMEYHYRRGHSLPIVTQIWGTTTGHHIKTGSSLKSPISCIGVTRCQLEI